jgi:hypothetical protein
MAFAALAEEEPPPPEPEPDLIIYDAAGNERDWAWLTAKYGPLVLHPAAPGPGWRVHILRERVDTHASIQVYAPQGTPVAWYWSDAPQAPDAGPLNGLPEGMNANRAFKGTTSAEGKVSFDMGQGAYYHPENGERGPHAVWIYGANTNSDVVFGLGMVSGTNNDHLDVSYWWKEEEPPPTEYYTLDIDIIPAEGGTVQGNTSPYEAGTTAHLEAVPADGWQFDGWTGDAQSSNSTLDLMMDADKHLAANFVEGDEPPEPDIEAAKAHIQKADELAALLREQLDLAMKALGVT